METLYLIALILIFTLAIFDLFVGVSNDAVNFLNSAVGSKAFKFKTILFIAALGIFVGASFSSGMMDIARHGIFQPQHFYFVEIMAIFMGVMRIFTISAFASFDELRRVFSITGAAFFSKSSLMVVLSQTTTASGNSFSNSLPTSNFCRIIFLYDLSKGTYSGSRETILAQEIKEMINRTKKMLFK